MTGEIPIVIPIARGVGYAVVGPAVGSALASPEVTRAAWSRIALPVGVGVAAGIVVGSLIAVWIGRRIA